MPTYKNKVILFRSIYSVVLGFMSFGYIAIMSNSGIPYAQISLLVTLNFLFQTVFYLVFSVARIRKGLIISSFLNLIVILILLSERNFLTFFIISLILGLADALFSSIVIIQKDFKKKDYSVLMSLTFVANVLGLGLYYFSFYIRLEYLLILLAGISSVNLFVSLSLKYEEEDFKFKDFLQFMKINGKFLITLDGLATLRRVFANSILPIVFISVFSYISREYLSLYFAVFQLPLVFFLYYGQKVSNKSYLLLTFSEFFIYILLIRFYYVSPIIFLGFILLIKSTEYLRAPIAEAALLQKIEYSTKVMSFFNFLDSILGVISGSIFTALIFIKAYSLVLLLAGVSSLSADLFLYRIIKEYKE